MIKDNFLTYGVEIEGLFSDDLIHYVQHDDNNHSIKYDGSVHFTNSEVDKANKNNPDQFTNDYREIASGVFHNKKDLLAFVKMFDSKNYHYNDTTGLHLHIGMYQGYDDSISPDRLQALICNYDFIKKLQDTIINQTCQCQKDRLLNHDFYCKTAKTSRDLTFNYRRNVKYSFLRFHPQGTLEFRFFKPCQHKLKNINTTINALLDYMNTDFNFSKHYIAKKQDYNLDNVFHLTNKIKLDNVFSFTNKITV